SRTSANGATRGETPFSISASAVAKAWRSSGRVSAPTSAARNSPTGVSARGPLPGEARAANERRQQQPVGLERAPDLHQRARQVVDELQRQCRRNEVERSVAKWQRLLVAHDRERRSAVVSRRAIGK